MSMSELLREQREQRKRGGPIKDTPNRSTSQGQCQLKELESKWPGISPEHQALSEQKTKPSPHPRSCIFHQPKILNPLRNKYQLLKLLIRHCVIGKDTHE